MATVRLRGVLPGVAGMLLAGGSVGVSATLTTAALFTARAVRYGAAGLAVLPAGLPVGRRPGRGAAADDDGGHT